MLQSWLVFRAANLENHRNKFIVENISISINISLIQKLLKIVVKTINNDNSFQYQAAV